MDIFVARQPIFDIDNNSIGYELFYRDGINNFFNKKVSGNAATSILLTNSYLTFGIENLVDAGYAFLNFDDYLINYGVVELLDKENVIIEILESVVPTKRLINKIKSLVNEGYIFAIDDYTRNYKYDEMFDLCKLVKVDFRINTPEDIIRIALMWGNGEKILLAEKVETEEEFEFAKTLGFKYFQGYYFAKPVIKKGKTFSDSAKQYLDIMSEMNEIEPDFNKIARTVEMDVSLSYKLLTLVNSNSRLKYEIGSIDHAISILGLNSFRRWLSLAMVQNVGETRVSELMKYSLLRYHMLSDIAQNSAYGKYRNDLMLMGTLSVIDALLEVSMPEILDSLALPMEFKKTLLLKKTKYSDAYRIPLEYEKGNFSEAEVYCKKINYNPEKLADHYIEAVKWANKMYHQLNSYNERK
jgi:EAL and modified HD-GYP domain-containing signal transduction protein